MLLKKLSAIAFAGIVTVLATVGPSFADGRRGGAGFAGRGSVGQFHRNPGVSRGFVVHPPARQFHGGFHRGFSGHHFHNRGFVVSPFIAAPFAFGWAYPPAYVPPAQTYWFCPTYGAYYPQVQSCPVPWQPVTGY
jgi:hypothetical protein